MALQSGPNPFRGKLGNVIGRKVNGKHYVSTGGGFTTEILVAEKLGKCKPTWDYASELGKSSPLGSTIYSFLKEKYQSNREIRACANLTGRIYTTLMAEPGEVGKRKPTVKTLSKLPGFHFNNLARYTVKNPPEITRPGSEKIDLYFNNLKEDLRWPKYKSILALEIFTLAIHINFKSYGKSTCHLNADIIPSEEVGDPYNFNATKPKGNCLFLLGHRFHTEVNGHPYLLSNQVYSPLQILNFFKT